MQRKFTDYLLITLKGMAMGTADVVPGVSGGTIAFIAGVYEELITSINRINIKAFKILFSKGLSEFWKYINGSFLLALFSGIAVSILSLVKGIKWLLENYPILLWAFFFGLVLASIYYLAKDIKKWNAGAVVGLIIGISTAYYISVMPPLGTEHGYLFLFFAGALAICAMILPGISGAFILVLLGAYHIILSAVNDFNIKILAVVGAGAIVGLLSFARLLKYMFSNYKNTTLAVLTGFVIGSLNKIWPWKEPVSFYLDSHGIEKPLLEKNILPFAYQGDAYVIEALILMIIGFFVIFSLEIIANRLKKQ